MDETSKENESLRLNELKDTFIKRKEGNSVVEYRQVCVVTDFYELVNKNEQQITLSKK